MGLPPSPGDQKRLVGMAVFLSLLFCLLIVRFYQIQIVEGAHWTQIALSQHQYVIDEPFRRGAFFSNTSIKKGHPEAPQPFVMDIPKFHLHVDADAIPSSVKENMGEELAGLLKLSKEEKRALKKELEKKSRSRRLASFLDRAKRSEIAEWWSGFAKREKIVRNGIFFLSDYQRSYPFGSMLGAVLHTVQAEKDPKTEQAIPTGGLELYLQSYLKGKKGKRQRMRSPSHPLDLGTLLEAPQDGADVYLTIHHYLQAIAEAELAKGVQAVKAKGGWAVLMDPSNGEILALAQVPSFHPGRYREYYNDPNWKEYTKVKAVTDCFEPASIFKPITVATCLIASEELVKQGKPPILTPEEWLATTNGWFPGRSTPLKDGRTHRFLNLDLALQKSSNIFMGRAAHRLMEVMGPSWYRNTLVQQFHFGEKTGVELPAESQGLVPTPGKVHPNGSLEWSKPTPYSLAIGHNVLVNSLQMVRAYAIIANGGFDVQPHLIRKIVRKAPGGTEEILVDKSTLGKGKQVMSPKVAARVLRALKFSTKEGGTSKRADIPGYTEGGKSGTSEKILDGQYSKDHYISSFVGVAPAKNPRFVLLVSIDDPEKKFIPGAGKQHHGGICAAPVFREIALKTLQFLGVAPDDPYGYPVGDPRRDPKKADWAFEVSGLKEEYKKRNGGE
jgi:cell division protein FtsI (penicillin-binding protein 3)